MYIPRHTLGFKEYDRRRAHFAPPPMTDEEAAEYEQRRRDYHNRRWIMSRDRRIGLPVIIRRK